MSRSTLWQRTASDAVSWHQDQALQSTIYILREVGPTSFLLKEDGETNKFKVSLGDPHSCNCSTFQKEKVPCKHICWILLKKFKLNRNNESSYQLGLVEREINDLLRGPTKSQILSITKPQAESGDGNDKALEQRPISEDDVCPICQDQLLCKRLPVTYCRYGCGNSVHIKCMKVWADHQLQSSDSKDIQCPFCRNNFGSHAHLSKELRNTMSERRQLSQLDSHPNTCCVICRMSPIKGKCYQCQTCKVYHLCNTCYHSKHHMQHEFFFRGKKAQRWRPAPSRSELPNETLNLIGTELQSREITESDYELLLELERPQNSTEIPVDLAGLPEHIINRLPLVKVRAGGQLLAPGRQCRLCLRAFCVGQFVRKLPQCGHLFHRECIDQWLSEDHRCCPVDRQPVTVPKTKENANINSPKVQHPTNSFGSSHFSQLIVPGIGLVRTSSVPLVGSKRSVNTKLPASVRVPRRHSSKLGRKREVPCPDKDLTFGDILIQADAIKNTPEEISVDDLNNMTRVACLTPAHISPHIKHTQKCKHIIAKHKVRNHYLREESIPPLGIRESFSLNGQHILKPHAEIGSRNFKNSYMPATVPQFEEAYSYNENHRFQQR